MHDTVSDGTLELIHGYNEFGVVVLDELQRGVFPLQRFGVTCFVGSLHIDLFVSVYGHEIDLTLLICVGALYGPHIDFVTCSA